jgi:hypothetical protein
MKITRQFLTDLKKADSMCIRFEGKRSTIDLFFQNYSGDSYATTYQYGDSGDYRGNWVLFLYPGMLTEIGCTLSLLKIDDRAVFIPRRGSNQYTDEAELNAHDLMLQINRHKKDHISSIKPFLFLLDHQICPTNSALNMTAGIDIL